jgi:phosphoglycerol transferase MdoB-like AlkP superfamily enzyme
MPAALPGGKKRRRLRIVLWISISVLVLGAVAFFAVYPSFGEPQFPMPSVE